MISVEEWEPVAGLQLEPNALNAVREQKNNIIVNAGPGAGKTELLAQRADFLLRTGVSPYPRRILAISFKVDAARNLQDRVYERSGAQYAARFDSYTFHAFAKRIVDNYRPALSGKTALSSDYQVDPKTSIPGKQITFDELVPLALEILASNQYARGALRQTYSHVFMDEFQDATGDQYELIRQAFSNTDVQLTGVGDTKQRIMGFAKALEGVMDSFASDFDATYYQLYQNHRSKPTLRRMQNRMILDMDPPAASHETELLGDEGVIRVLSFDSERSEASTVADLVSEWLTAGIPSEEITVIVRQQPHLVAPALRAELLSRGIASRNEQEAQNLTAEPVAALILNYLRVIADDRDPDSYNELMRVVTREEFEESDGILESRVHTLLASDRRTVRTEGFSWSAPESWRPLIANFLKFVTDAALRALSPSYQQGTWLEEVIDQTLDTFQQELDVDRDPVAALQRLSESDAIRILTVHKCKGLEFEKVILLGVEKELFWGYNPEVVKSEFFVAISRAKDELILTHVKHRTKPSGGPQKWRATRTPHAGLLAYAYEFTAPSNISTPL